MVKIGVCLYGSYREIKTVASLFWTTLYMYRRTDKFKGAEPSNIFARKIFRQRPKNALCKIALPDAPHLIIRAISNRKAELSQRWPRDAPYIWCSEKFRESL